MAKYSRRSPSAAARSPRSYLASSSFDTANLPNPFQDSTSSFETAATPTPAAPVASDTTASSTLELSKHSRSAVRRENSHNTNNMTAATMAATSSVPRDKSSNTNGHYDQDEGEDQDQDQDQEQENPLIFLTDVQREAAVENLDIEIMDRVQTMRASIGVLTNSIRFRCEAELNRLPAAIRAMTVEEFWFTYNGNAKEYLNRQAAKKTVANTSFLHEIQNASKHPARYKPYPGAAQSQFRQTTRPFVDLRLAQSSKRKE
ncbi:hypothetical protein BGZ98_008920 [Dissophora globulifera]|nr:hypothetical protein BGZ98_008920 [Dissophora globulifera]